MRAGGHGAKINGDGTASSVTITLLTIQIIFLGESDDARLVS